MENRPELFESDSVGKMSQLVKNQANSLANFSHFDQQLALFF